MALLAGCSGRQCNAECALVQAGSVPIPAGWCITDCYQQQTRERGPRRGMNVAMVRSGKPHLCSATIPLRADSCHQKQQIKQTGRLAMLVS